MVLQIKNQNTYIHIIKIEYTLITDTVTKNTPNMYGPLMIMRHCYYVHNY